LKRGVATGSANGFKALKRSKTSAVDQAIASIEQGQLSLERDRLEWEKARAEQLMTFREKTEENRHREVLRIEEGRSKDSLAMIQLEMAQMENERRKIDLEMALLEERRTRGKE
jgi:hypothetical protein